MNFCSLTFVLSMCLWSCASISGKFWSLIHSVVPATPGAPGQQGFLQTIKHVEIIGFKIKTIDTAGAGWICLFLSCLRFGGELNSSYMHLFMAVVISIHDHPWDRPKNSAPCGVCHQMYNIWLQWIWMGYPDDHLRAVLISSVQWNLVSITHTWNA